MAPAAGGRVTGPWGRIGAALVLATAAVAAVSWMAADLTRNDFERLDDLRRAFLFFGLLCAAAGAYLAAWARPAPVPRRGLAGVTTACAVLALATFPVGSKDVFGYAVFGRLWMHHGVDPLRTAPSAFPDDPWYAYIADVRWRDWPVVYGPLAVWQAGVTDRLAGGNLWAAVWLYKLWALGFFAATLTVAAAIVRRQAAPVPRTWLVLLLAWNPLLHFETAGNGHNDIAMVLAVCAALWCHGRGHPRAGIAVLAAAFWYKWYSVLFLPAFVVDRLRQSPRAAGGDVAVAVAALAGAGALAFLPFPGALPAVVEGLRAPRALQGIYPAELSPVLAPLFWLLVAAGAFATPWGGWIFDGIRGAAFVAAAAAITWRQWRRPPAPQALAESCCLWATAFTMLVPTMLLPWHLLTPIVLAVLCGREPFLRLAAALTTLALASYFLTFAGAALALGLAAAALWALRRGRPLLARA